jgi:hypothetical protein
MIFVIANTKGGVGKSAFAMQAVAPYLCSRHGGCALYEIDDFNFDSSDYENSMIKCESLKLEKGVARVIDSLIQASAQNENLVIDVGGNQTCGEMLEALGKSSLASMINGFVIPVSQTGKDVENANKTIELIREYMPNNCQNIFLGVARIDKKFGIDDVEYMMPDAIEMATEANVKDVLLLHDDVSVPGSRKLGMSVWELATNAEAYIDGLNERMLDEQVKEPVDIKEMRLINRHVVCVEHAKHYLPKLEAIFTTLDRFYAPAVSAGSKEAAAVPAK